MGINLYDFVAQSDLLNICIVPIESMEEVNLDEIIIYKMPLKPGHASALEPFNKNEEVYLLSENQAKDFSKQEINFHLKTYKISDIKDPSELSEEFFHERFIGLNPIQAKIYHSLYYFNGVIAKKEGMLKIFGDLSDC